MSTVCDAWIERDAPNHKIADPVSYELSYKMTQFWSLEDLTTFVEQYLNAPKHFYAISFHLPHKAYKEIVFLFYSFKKMWNLKRYHKMSYQYFNLPFASKPWIPDTAREILMPLHKI